MSFAARIWYKAATPSSSFYSYVLQTSISTTSRPRRSFARPKETTDERVTDALLSRLSEWGAKRGRYIARKYEPWEKHIECSQRKPLKNNRVQLLFSIIRSRMRYVANFDNFAKFANFEWLINIDISSWKNLSRFFPCDTINNIFFVRRFIEPKVYLGRCSLWQYRKKTLKHLPSKYLHPFSRLSAVFFFLAFRGFPMVDHTSAHRYGEVRRLPLFFSYETFNLARVALMAIVAMIVGLACLPSHRRRSFAWRKRNIWW